MKYFEFFLIFISFILAGYSLSFSFDSLNHFNIYEILKSWQTLIAGLVALLGAKMTVDVMNRQHNENKDAVGIKVRASLNGVVNLFIDYSRDCMDFIREIGDLPDTKNTDSAIILIAENIPYVDKKTAEFLKEMIIFYQVHNARLKSYERSKKTPFIDISRTILTFHSMTLDLISFARFENGKPLIKNPKANDLLDAGKSLFDLERTLYNFSSLPELLDSIKPLNVKAPMSGRLLSDNDM